MPKSIKEGILVLKLWGKAGSSLPLARPVVAGETRLGLQGRRGLGGYVQPGKTRKQLVEVPLCLNYLSAEFSPFPCALFQAPGLVFCFWAVRGLLPGHVEAPGLGTPCKTMQSSCSNHPLKLARAENTTILCGYPNHSSAL